MFHVEHISTFVNSPPDAKLRSVPRGTLSENVSASGMFHVEHFCAKAGQKHPQVTIAAAICLTEYAALKSVIANAQRFGLFCIGLSDSSKLNGTRNRGCQPEGRRR